MQIDKHILDEKSLQPIVAYLCDRKACDNCANPECKHTTDIEHAVNFTCVDEKNGKYMEKEME